jgi:cellulose synthase/poly-beta-1,6-N-acetylglucosamine synthase-like glycosyltransferase
MLTPESLFWVALLFFLHPYSTYPLSLVCLKYFTKKKRRFRTEHSTAWDSVPKVSVLVVAHNEQNAIRARLENLCSMDYPSNRVSILVVSDASTDQTDGIVESYRGTVQFLRSPERIGKAACTNLGLQEIRDEYVVFTDANTEFDTDAISKLIGPFQDPSIGYVVGFQDYRAVKNAPAERSESSYSRIETWLKQMESDVSSVVGGDGAIMAIRRSIIGRLASDDVSDLRMPLECVALGYRGVFLPEAKGWEIAPELFSDQLVRKTRIIHRSIRTTFRAWRVLNPFRTGWFAYMVVSHKLLRWFGPLMLILSVSCASILTFQGHTIYRLYLLAVLLFMTVAGAYAIPALRNRRVIYLSFYFCLVQYAALLAILRLHRKGYYTLWEPVRKKTIE